MVLKFVLDNDERVMIFKDDKLVGHIFSPGGSGNNNINCIQVCGFSDIFEHWGCGVFKGFKDIQMYFGDFPMGGKFTTSLSNCIRCYHTPCQCHELVLHKRYEDVMNKRIAEKI